MNMRTVVGAMIAVCALTAGVWWQQRIAELPLAALQLNAVVPAETVFPEPRHVSWEGVVTGLLAGGRGIAVRRNPPDAIHAPFQAYFSDDQTRDIRGLVLIEGDWIGISCAYQNTVFSGQCVPEVQITDLRQLPIELK